MRHVHTYHCTKMRRYRALSKPLVASSVCRSWADCIINIAGFDLRQAQAGPLNNAPDYDVAACITRLNCLDGSVVVGVSVMPPISRLGLAQLPSWRGRNANAPALDVCNGVTSSNLYVP